MENKSSRRDNVSLSSFVGVMLNAGVNRCFEIRVIVAGDSGAPRGVVSRDISAWRDFSNSTT